MSENIFRNWTNIGDWRSTLDDCDGQSMDGESSLEQTRRITSFEPVRNVVELLGGPRCLVRLVWIFSGSSATSARLRLTSLAARNPS